MSNSGPFNRKRITLGESQGKREVASGEGRMGVIEEPFPTGRTYHWIPISSHTNKPCQGEAAIPLLVTQEVLEAITRHVSTSLEYEIGGFLLGNYYRCPNSSRDYVLIDNFAAARFTNETEVSLSFTVETWAHFRDQLQTKFRGKLLIGWYHSHPRMDIFLSAMDREIHEERFDEPWMSALVIEPETKRGGFFGWAGGQLNTFEPVDFYEYLELNSRNSVMGWTNYVRQERKDGHG